MALYRYFKASDTKLPDPRGPLSKDVPSTAIAAANGEVKHVVELQRGKTRGPYTKFTPEQKAEIGKRAAEHGVVATVRYYEKRFPGNTRSVRKWAWSAGIFGPRNLFPRKFANGLSAKILSLENLALYGNEKCIAKMHNQNAC